MIYFEDASEKQLQQIALYEDCQIEYKYAAARELQLRKWTDQYLTDLVCLWGHGMSTFQIAIEIGIDEWIVKKQLTKHGLYKRRVLRNEHQNQKTI